MRGRLIMLYTESGAQHAHTIIRFTQLYVWKCAPSSAVYCLYWTIQTQIPFKCDANLTAKKWAHRLGRCHRRRLHCRRPHLRVWFIIYFMWCEKCLRSSRINLPNAISVQSNLYGATNRFLLALLIRSENQNPNRYLPGYLHNVSALIDTLDNNNNNNTTVLGTHNAQHIYKCLK